MDDDKAHWTHALRRAGYTMVLWPSVEDPELICGLRIWPRFSLVDVVVVAQEDVAAAYQVRCDFNGNPFNPGILLWSVEGWTTQVVDGAVKLDPPSVPNPHATVFVMPESIARMVAPLRQGFLTMPPVSSAEEPATSEQPPPYEKPFSGELPGADHFLSAWGSALGDYDPRHLGDALTDARDNPEQPAGRHAWRGNASGVQ